MHSRQRRAAAAFAVTATLTIGGVVASLTPASSDTLPLPPLTTTTTLIADPFGSVTSLLPSSSEETTTTTSTTVPPTTTTTVPPDEDPVDQGTAHGGDVRTEGEGRSPLTPIAPNTPAGGTTSAVSPVADAGKAAVGAVTAAPVVGVPTVAVPLAAGSAVPSAPSPVLLDATASISLPPAGGRSTRALLDVLFGMDMSPALLARVVAPFPVAGEATYSDDWLNPRFTPQFHLHEGTDVFAAAGTPVVASADGSVVRGVGSGAGGNWIRLTEPDGTYYYYAHLDRFAVGLRSGESVQKGDIIGFVGTSGNAEGGTPHLHFEIHPKGGAAVPPVPYLDRWLSEALVTATTLKSQPGAAGSIVQLKPSKGAARDALLRPAASQRPLPTGTTLDPSAGLEITVAVLFLLWVGRRFQRKLAARQAGV